MKERVIITGANGQLGKQLQEELSPEEYDIYPFDKKLLDVTNISRVQQVVQEIRPHIIIHCAAYTKVDRAEKEQRSCLFNKCNRSSKCSGCFTISRG